jgi:hypothetical protein
MTAAHRSLLAVLKSVRSFAITPLSLPNTFLPDEAAAEAELTRTMSGACELRRAASSDNQSRMNDRVCVLYTSSDWTMS